MKDSVCRMVNLLSGYMPILALTLIFGYSLLISMIWGQVVEAADGDHDDLYENEAGIGGDRGKPELDVNFLIKEALDKNPEIAAARQRWEAAKNKIKVEKTLEDPELRLGKMNSPDHPFNIGAEAVKMMPIMSAQTIGIMQKFPFPGKLRLRGEVASEEAEMERMLMEAKIQEIITEVKLAYYDLYLVYKSIEITQENRDLLQRFTKIAESMYSVGNVSQRDVLAAMVELSKISNELVILEQRKVSLQARICNLLNRYPSATLDRPKEFKKHTLNLDAHALEEIASREQPMLQRFDHAVKKDKLNLELAKKDYYSDLTAMLTYNRIDQPSDTWSSELSINIPWLWSKQRSKVKEAKEELKAATADLEAWNNLTLYEIRDIISRIVSADSTVALFNTSVIPQAEQSLDAARIGYETGKVDFLTLIDSQRTLLDAKLQYYSSLVEFEQNLARLEKAVGVELTRE